MEVIESLKVTLSKQPMRMQMTKRLMTKRLFLDSSDCEPFKPRQNPTCQSWTGHKRTIWTAQLGQLGWDTGSCFGILIAHVGLLFCESQWGLIPAECVAKAGMASARLGSWDKCFGCLNFATDPKTLRKLLGWAERTRRGGSTKQQRSIHSVLHNLHF